MAQGKKQYVLKIKSVLFDDIGNLRPIQKADWNDDYIRLDINDLNPVQIEPVDDLPF